MSIKPVGITFETPQGGIDVDWFHAMPDGRYLYAIPDTHRVVPVKPAPEMINAALPHAMRESDEDKYRAIGMIICIWDEMLAATKEKGE